MQAQLDTEFLGKCPQGLHPCSLDLPYLHYIQPRFDFPYNPKIVANSFLEMYAFIFISSKKEKSLVSVLLPKIYCSYIGLCLLYAVREKEYTYVGRLIPVHLIHPSNGVTEGKMTFFKDHKFIQLVRYTFGILCDTPHDASYL